MHTLSAIVTRIWRVNWGFGKDIELVNHMAPEKRGIITRGVGAITSAREG